MRPGKIVLVILGVLAALVGFACAAGGGALVWAHATQRDAAGFYATSAHRFDTATYALTSRVDLGAMPGDRDWTFDHPAGTVRIRASSADSRALFVGIAPQSDVDRWLAGTPHQRVTRVNFGPFGDQTVRVSGERPATPPSQETFWAASQSGPGTQTLLWPSEHGRWTVVVMNTDARAGVAADVSVGAKTGVLLPIGLGLGSFGLLLLGASGLMLFFGLRHQTAPVGGEEIAAPVSVPGAYAVRLDGHLDAGLSRWLWLVKWILVIPHVVVLVFLWLAVTVLTIVAGFAILFTGRYPRSIFNFNVAVMQWTWRVSFYAMNAFGTDRYPPFTLRPVPDYPAQFSVDYPEHLSRGLVLVKWWLLAIPHYIVVAIFAGGWGLGWTGGWRVAGGGGLIAILTLVAVVVLLFRGTYPQQLFDFIMGLNRWCFRVLAYVALMRDEYPPFRLDMGGTDPGTPPPPPPTAPTQPSELVGAPL